MKIVLLLMGKTNDSCLSDHINNYVNRINRYNKLEIIEIPNIKSSSSLPINTILLKESDLILNYLKESDHLILLDKKGVSLSSVGFARKMQDLMFLSKKRIVFLVGGSYGVEQKIYSRADESISLSDMTFPHQIVRIFFVEQLYRSYTILNNESYHH